MVFMEWWVLVVLLMIPDTLGFGLEVRKGMIASVTYLNESLCLGTLPSICILILDGHVHVKMLKLAYGIIVGSLA
jgi:hypothetical protein